MKFQANAEPEIVEQLRESQRELAIGHDFFQTFYAQTRNQVTAYIQTISAEILEHFLESYGRMKEIQSDTEESFNNITGADDCMAGVWRRWDLQVARHGQRLSSCLEWPVHEFGEWNFWLNQFIAGSQSETNKLQNAGIEALADTFDFTAENHNLPQRINRAFRLILASAADDLDTFEEYRQHILEEEEEIIDELTACDRRIVASFENEARIDLEWADACQPIP
jgi:hypothetical protein